MTVKYSGIVLDVANQRGGSQPSVVTLDDHSRYGNDGAMTNVTWTQLPSGLWVMGFDGSSVVDCGSDNSLYPASITLIVWLRLEEAAPIGNPRIIGCFGQDITFRGFGLFQVVGSRRVLYEFGLTVVNLVQVDIATPSLNSWHQYAVTYDGSNIIPYYDGGAGTPRAQVDTIHYPTPENFRIGENFSFNFWVGSGALAKLYNCVLTPAQIRSRYSATRSLFGV